jgi:adenosylcobyric acid synthase
MDDLVWMNERGLSTTIRQCAERGVPVVGICGGYQMLGRRIKDPSGVESRHGEMAGLGLLPVETIFETTKATYQAKARVTDGPSWMTGLHNETLEGYEIHMGQTAGDSAWLEIVERNGQAVSHLDGAVNDAGMVWGSYLHGIFGNDRFRRAWLGFVKQTAKKDVLLADQADMPFNSASSRSSASTSFQESLDRLADAVEESLDIQKLKIILEGQ